MNKEDIDSRIFDGFIICWKTVGDIFEKWKPEDRDEFLVQARKILRRTTRMPIGNSVNQQDFEAVALPQMQKIMGGAYGFCAYVCLHQIKQYCDSIGYKKPVDVVFEAGADGWKQINQLFVYLADHQQLKEFYRLGSITFDTKRIRQFQAADFLSYDLGRSILDANLGRFRFEVSDSLKALLNGISTDYVKFRQRETLVKHAEIMRDAGWF